jgi:hypothetical protein
MLASKRRIDRTFTVATRFINYVVHLVRRQQPDAIKTDTVRGVIDELHDHYGIFRTRWREMRQPFLWAFVANLTEVLAIYVVYVAFGEWVNFGAVILAYAIANFAGAIAILPGGVGIFEAKLKTERARVTKKRVKAPGVVAKGVKFLKEFQGLRGQTPEKLVNAKKAYVFDVEARKLKVFIATGDGFTFTGTTLKNFDAEKSKAKTVRKPELLAAVPMNLSSLNKFFGDIKAVEGSVNGRFNENTIILTVG